MVDITGVIDCTIDDPSGKGERAAGFIPRCVFIKPKSKLEYGFIVLQRLQHHDGKPFIAPTFCDTKPEAEMYASNFDNIVAIMPIEWEE